MLTFNLKQRFHCQNVERSLSLPYIFCQLHSKCPYNKKNITRQLKDMDFMFSWQEQYLTRSLRSLVRYFSCNSNIKSISSRNRVISSIYPQNRTSVSLYISNLKATFFIACTCVAIWLIFP